MKLRDLPSISQMFQGELSGKPVPPFIGRILGQFWPECFESTQGVVVMSDEERANLEALYEMFGVPMLVKDNSLKMLGRGYDVFCLGMGPSVRRCLSHPVNFRAYLRDWPQDWFDYVVAIAAGDLPLVRKLANKLQPLAPDCVFPPKFRKIVSPD